MIYRGYQAYADMLDPVRALARLGRTMLDNPAVGLPTNFPARALAAAWEVVAETGLSHVRPPFGIDCVEIDGRSVAVTEEVADVTPFGTLLRFRKEAVDAAQPRVLLVAPLSGHFATLLRATVRTMLPEHDVYITDWHNARDVPVEDGPFGLDEYVDHLIRFLRKIGPGGHIIAVCQPCVQALTAAAIMAEDKDPAAPLSMTLMASPIDTRVNPTRVNEMATANPIEWFDRNLIGTVPARYPGAGRRVYPGFVQVSAFLSMNLDRHVRAHLDLMADILRGEVAKARSVRAFYDEYFAVLDLTAEFYLETVERVFQRYDLALGRLTWHGRPVDPALIRRTALLTVEGERDDICSVGQTLAAHELCTGIKPFRKRHHLQPGAGHYGVFSGSRWTGQVYPLVKNHILAND